MPSPIDMASDVASAGGTLAGLTLVFIGAVVGAFESYSKDQRTNDLIAKYKKRVWWAFVGFSLSLAATGAGFVGKLYSAPALVGIGSTFLFFAFAVLFWLALDAAMGVK